MNRKKALVSFVAAFVMIAVASSYAFSADRGNFSTAPKTNNGEKWRIAYCEGGPYANYPANLRAIVYGFMELGWIERMNVPEGSDPLDAEWLWNWMVRNVRSKYIEFLADGFWTAKWDKKAREKNKEEIIQRLSKKKDIDFIIAMGTWAGQDLANNRHSVPTMVVSTSDPVRANIVKCVEDSGLDHVHAKCDPTRYIRQVRLFHEIIGFQKLGIVYENTVEGRTYGAIEDVERVAKELGFEIVMCEAPFSSVEEKVAAEGVIKCHEKLAPKVDAVYITVHRGVVSKYMPMIMAPLFKHKLPTFSQRGSTEVRYGVLFSISRAGFRDIGKFHAEVAAKVFNGAKPRDLDQVFEDPKKIAINLETAQIIEYDPPVDILGSADEIYEKIEKPE
ncbi:MAG: ABC transporter substrate-binding protein [Deltaproteobacteria bacterium]|nr:ABC transporter substrate-binding protein [Deltaproteobacteria bacterium]